MAIRFTWDTTKTVDLLAGEGGAPRQKLSQARSQNIGGSGTRETLCHYGDLVVVLDAYFTAAAYRQLMGWWSWARQGQLFSVAYDTGRMSSTTLDGAHGATSTGLTLTSASGISDGDELWIQNLAADNQFEAVAVDGSGSPLPIDRGLTYSYPSGSLVRHLDYFPSLISLDDDFNPTPVGDRYYHTFSMVSQ